jgi:hypothetical protein
MKTNSPVQIPEDPRKPPVKVIYANTYRLNQPDDLSYPFKMEALLHHPTDFMSIAALFLYGPNEHAIAIGMSIEDLMDWAWKSDGLPRHPRLIRLTISNRQGTVIHTKQGRNSWVPAFQYTSVSQRLRNNLLPTDCPLFG